MSTLKLLLAWSSTAGVWNSTLDRWIEFSDAARTQKWLVRDPLAWLAIAQVTELCTLMFIARKHLLALN